MNNLANLFMYGHGQYYRILQFEVLVFIVIIVTFITRAFHKTYAFVIILFVFVFYLSGFYINTRTRPISDFNKQTMLKLNIIQDKINNIVVDHSFSTNKYKQHSMDCLFYDANIIHFIHSIIILAEYNPTEFYLFVKGVNNILKIRKEIEDFYNVNHVYPENIASLLENCLRLKTLTINNLHNFIYSIPKTSKMYNYIDDIVERHNILITRNIDYIYKYYLHNIQLSGINNQTRFITYNNTKPFDALDNHKIITSKFKTSSMPQFYI